MRACFDAINGRYYIALPFEECVSLSWWGVGWMKDREFAWRLPRVLIANPSSGSDTLVRGFYGINIKRDIAFYRHYLG
jgi:hypothetical protein